MSIGKIAYNGYASYTQFTSVVTGSPLPQWEDLNDQIKAAWEASAKALKEQLDKEPVNVVMKVTESSHGKVVEPVAIIENAEELTSAGFQVVTLYRPR